MKATDCVCMVFEGQSYGHGEKIPHLSDSCSSAYCMEGEIHRIGIPCGVYQTPKVTLENITTNFFYVRNIIDYHILHQRFRA